MIFFLNGFQNLHQPPFSQVAGGAAAEIDGVHRVPGGKGSRLRQVGAEGVRVVAHAALVPGQGVEVAVDAFLLAEGNVDVQPQGLDGGFHGDLL